MKRIVMLILTVFSMLVGSAYLIFNLSGLLLWILSGYAIPLRNLTKFTFLILLSLLMSVGSLYTLIMTHGFKRWNDELPGRVKGIAITSWLTGVLIGMPLLCLLVYTSFLNS